MIVLYVKFESSLTEEEVLAVADERADDFRALPGLIQKYYVKASEPNHYGGVYIWESMEAMQAYRESDLAMTIPEAYKIVGAPKLEVLDVLFPLRA